MRPYLFAVVCLFMQFSTRAQAVSDSVTIKQVTSAFLLANSNPDSALAIAIKGIRQSEKGNNKRLEAFSYKTKGWAFLRLGNYDSCFYNLLTATEIFKALNDNTEIMYLYANLADVYSAHSQFTEGARYLLLADSLARQKNDLAVQANIKKQMGILYRQQREYQKAIHYLKESMQGYRGLNDTIHFCDVAGSLGITYNEMSMPDSSLPILKECMSEINRLRGVTYQKAMMHERLGDTYFALASYTQALDDYKAAYDLFKADKNKADLAYEAINLGKVYIQANNHDEAEKYLLQAYRINDSLAMTHYAHDAAGELAALYKKQRDWQKAFRWLETTAALNDSLQLGDQNEKIADLQAKYETEKKDKEISLLRKNRELDLLTLQKQKTFRYSAMALLVLLVLVGFLVINRYRIVQRARRQVEMEKLRNNIARDLHDDMGSSLSSIHIISKVALENQHENGNIREQLKKIQYNSAYMLESMSDIVWAINPANDSFEKTLFKMKEFAADILEPLNIQYEFISNGSPAIPPDINQRKELYLIFKEAINNAAKYSHCTRVVINIQADSNEIILQVKDNGRGFDTNAVTEGNGLENTRRRAKQMNGEALIASKKDEGTTVTVRIKSHH